jgi:hypothetical protein
VEDQAALDGVSDLGLHALDDVDGPLTGSSDKLGPVA